MKSVQELKEEIAQTEKRWREAMDEQNRLEPSVRAAMSPGNVWSAADVAACAKMRALEDVVRSCRISLPGLERKLTAAMQLDAITSLAEAVNRLASAAHAVMEMLSRTPITEAPFPYDPTSHHTP